MVLGFIKYPEGSVLIQAGDTWVLRNATIEHLLAVQQQVLREAQG